MTTQPPPPRPSWPGEPAAASLAGNVHPMPPPPLGMPPPGPIPVPNRGQQHQFQQPQFRMEPETEVSDVSISFVRLATAIAKVCATRILLLIAVITACGVWSYTVFDPTHLRIIAAGVFCTVTVFPLVGLYWRKGDLR